MRNIAAELGPKILADVKDDLGAIWKGLSDADKALLEMIAQDAAMITVQAVVDPAGAAKAKAEIDAQIKNIKCAATARISTSLWTIATKILQMAIAVLLK